MAVSKEIKTQAEVKVAEAIEAVKELIYNLDQQGYAKSAHSLMSNCLADVDLLGNNIKLLDSYVMRYDSKRLELA